MRLYEINDNVIRFPSRDSASQVEVPPGYDSFYMRDAGPRTAHIMGVRPDGKHVKLSTTSKEAADALVRAYNRGGRSDVPMEPVSMKQAAGSDAMRAFEAMKVRFVEKPQSWEEIKNKSSCSSDQLWKVGEHLGGIAEVSPQEMFLRSSDPLPLHTTRKGLPDTVVLAMPDGDRFVADRGGSRNYYRFWTYVRPHGLSLVPAS